MNTFLAQQKHFIHQETQSVKFEHKISIEIKHKQY